jgi:thioesterase domain-containing protein
MGHPTPRAASRWLKDCSSRAADASALVTLQAGGAATPLFCVPGIGGEPMGYLHLATRIGRDRPVYGFRANISREPPGQALRIEQIASEYIDDLDSIVTSDQPVHLCGHSFGGIVALEMAHQLQARGRQLGLFAIIDTPLGAGRPGLIGTMFDTLTNLPAWLWYDAFESSGSALMARTIGKSAEAWRRIRSFVNPRADTSYPDFRSYFGTRHVSEAVAAHVRARLDAARRYVRRPLPGTVVLFRSRAQALMGRSDRCLGWDALASAVEVFDVPGHHDSCTRPPHVDHLAATLAARLSLSDVQ